MAKKEELGLGLTLASASPYAAVGLAAFSAYQSIKEAKAEAELLEEQADLLDMSAERLLSLNAENTLQTLQNSKETKGASKTGDAARGFSIDTVSLADITSEALREIDINTNEANFKAKQFRLEAKSKRDNAKNTKKAGKIGAVTSILSTAVAAG